MCCKEIKHFIHCFHINMEDAAYSDEMAIGEVAEYSGLSAEEVGQLVKSKELW